MTAIGHAGCANDLACNSLLLLKYQLHSAFTSKISVKFRSVFCY